MKGSSAAHSELITDTMLCIGVLPYIRCWKRVVGTFYRVHFDDRGKVEHVIAVKIGVEGEPDIDGIITRMDGAGIRFGVECKTGSATQTKEQKNYQKMLEGRGGIYIVGKTAQQVREILESERLRGA